MKKIYFLINYCNDKEHDWTEKDNQQYLFLHA
jgi:hypothetical protein